MCGMRLAENAGPKKVAKNRHLGTIAQICRTISSQPRHISTIGKNLLGNNISSTCPDNMVNFGPLAAKIVSLVWGTPTNFNGFRVLAALLHGTPVVGVSQTLRPSRWALAHILVFLFFCVCHSFLVFFAFVVLDLVSSVLSQYTELLSEVLCLS